MGAWGTDRGILGNDWMRLDRGRVTIRVGDVGVEVAGDVVVGEFPKEDGGVGLRVVADQIIAVAEGMVEREK